MTTIITARHASPIGEIIIGACDNRLYLCYKRGDKLQTAIHRHLCRHLSDNDLRYMPGTSDVIRRAASQLDEYFDRKRTTFDIPLSLIGTDFQRAVWHSLAEIPYGATASYKELALRAGNPGAVRATASAIAINPLTIFIPCHRIIGSDRRLTGYSGGLEAKKFMLEMEAGINRLTGSGV